MSMSEAQLRELGALKEMREENKRLDERFAKAMTDLVILSGGEIYAFEKLELLCRLQNVQDNLLYAFLFRVGHECAIQVWNTPGGEWRVTEVDMGSRVDDSEITMVVDTTALGEELGCRTIKVHPRMTNFKSVSKVFDGVGVQFNIVGLVDDGSGEDNEIEFKRWFVGFVESQLGDSRAALTAS